MQFTSITQRTLKQLQEIFPALKTKSNVKKSSSLQAFYKVIPCPPLSPKIFKQSLENLNQLSQQKPEECLLKLHQTLKKTEQYFTACINILEHNEKVRQKYQLVTIEEEKFKQQQMKQVNEVVRSAGSVGSKGQFREFMRQKGNKILQCESHQSTEPIRKPLQSSQLKQLYLPANPDQYSFITLVQQDQYLVYHQETLQKLLIELTQVNKINRQLSATISIISEQSTLSQTLIQSLKQMLTRLSVDELFRVQDNRYNQVVKFVLHNVHEASGKIEKGKGSAEGYRTQIKQSFLRQYYLQFMARQQLQVIKNHLYTIIKDNNSSLMRSNNNHHLLKVNLQQIKKQFNDFTSLRKEVKMIGDFLCDKEEKFFRPFYNRKIRKVILAINQVNNLLTSARKINQKIIDISSNEDHSNNNTPPSQRQSSKSTKSLVKQKDYDIKGEIQKFKKSFQSLEQEIQNFLNTLEQINQPQTYTAIFRKLFRQLQQIQLKYSELDQRQSTISSINENEGQNKLDSSLKLRILDIEEQLIESVKQKSKLKGVPLFQGYQSNESHNEDDKQSVVSGLSSKSSLFEPYILQQSDVILPKPSLVNQNYLPPLSLEQLIKTVNDFITNQFVKNNDLLKQLEDRKNVNWQKLQCLIYQCERNLSPVIQLQKVPVQQQSPVKSVKKQQVSPQKNKQKGKAPNQKSPQKSPHKSPQKTLKKPSQKQISPKKPTTTAQNQQAKNKQTITNLKNKLILIREILCPQISQCRVSRIFQQNLHMEIFLKFFSIITGYKQRIFTQKVYSDAGKYGFITFVEQRVNFLNTLIKNQKELSQVFNFIRIFSQKKVKLQSTDENTFDIILKALLASKQVQAYRKENNDLAKNNKLSSNAVKLLEDQVYVPFISMFKYLLKIVSSDDSIVRELEAIFQNVRQCLQLKDDIRNIVVKDELMSLSLPQLMQKIQGCVSQIAVLRRFSILKYSKLQSISKVLRNSLSLQSKSNQQEKKIEIINYLKDQLLTPQKVKSQPLLI